MKKTRFTEDQMVTILREADQRPIAEVAKKHGVSDQTIYAWRKRFGTLEPSRLAPDYSLLRRSRASRPRLCCELRACPEQNRRLRKCEASPRPSEASGRSDELSRFCGGHAHSSQ